MLTVEANGRSIGKGADGRLWQEVRGLREPAAGETARQGLHVAGREEREKNKEYLSCKKFSIVQDSVTYRGECSGSLIRFGRPCV